VSRQIYDPKQVTYFMCSNIKRINLHTKMFYTKSYN